MNLTLTRKRCTGDGIFGELSEESGDICAVTLEHAYAIMGAPFGWEPKIPPGQYLCRRGTHRLASMTQDFETFEITGVPGHSNILFHCGNYNADSEGCVLLGIRAEESMIMQSREAFACFMAAQAGLDSFLLNVI